MVLETDTPENRPNEPESTAFVTTLTSLVVAVAATINKRSPGTRRAYVSRKSPNSRGRKGAFKGPLGIQAGDRREICPEILHHQSRWNCCSSVSLRGMGEDRAEAGESAQIRGEVAVLGNLTYLEVRNLEAFRKEIEEQAFTDDDTKTLDELGI